MYISLISKLENFIQFLKDEFKEGHEWVVILSINNLRTSYDTLFECQKCHRKIWRTTPHRLKTGIVFKEIK